MLFKNFYKNFHLFLLMVFIYFNTKAYSYEFELNNDKNSIDEMAKKINSIISMNQVKVVLNENNYIITSTDHIHLILENTLHFYSKNGTVFDFNSLDNGSFIIQINSGLVNKKLIFENITFYNYGMNPTISLFDIEYKDDYNTFTIEFNNCTFLEIRGKMFNFKVSCTKSKQTSPQVIFNKCKFM